jgi:hypothetical protein
MSVLINNKYNIELWQGSTFSLTVTVKDSAGNAQNITGYDARMQIRSSYDAGAVTESLSVSNGEITITGSNGTMYLELSAPRTANIFVDLSNGKPPKNAYVYDLEMIDTSNNVTKLLYGDVYVYGEVTR